MKEKTLATKSLRQTETDTRHDNRLKAKAHPLRRSIWRILSERTASPKELADELEAKVPLCSHHTKRLVKLGVAELVEKRQVRGAIEHFYRATERETVDDSEFVALLEDDPDSAREILCSNYQLQIDDFTKSVEAGILGSDDEFLVDRTKVVVDARGCRELLDLFDGVEVDAVTAIVQRSAERRAASGEEAVSMSVNLAIIKTVPADC
jgi:hypothetical protein